MKKIKLSIVVPCYNEERILTTTVKKLEKFLFTNRKLFVGEIILVNDGSSDMTYKLSYLSASNKSYIKVVTYPENMGKGYAVRQGIMYSKYNNILILDADLSVKPEEVLKPEVITKLEIDKPFIIAGQRVQVVKQPIHRRFVGNVFSYLHRFLFRWDIIDSQSPFKILHNIPKEFVSELNIDGFAYDVELLYKAKQKNIPIYKVSVDYINDEDSKVTLRKTIRMGLDLFKVRYL